MKGIDASFARIDEPTFSRFYEAGYRVFVQDCWAGGYANNAGLRAVAEANLRHARAAGLIPAIYSNANPWFPPGTSVAETKANAGSMWDAVKVVAVDLEIAGTTEQQAYDLGMAVEAEGKRVILYTGKWVHDRDGQPPWTSLARWKLWTCDTINHDPNLAAARRYGPWKAGDIVGRQYDTDTGLLGVKVDLDVFEDSLFKEEDEVTNYRLFTKEEAALLGNVRVQMGQPTPLTSVVTDAQYNEQWAKLYEMMHTPVEEQLSPPSPLITQSLTGDFMVNVTRGYIKVGDELRWLL